MLKILVLAEHDYINFTDRYVAALPLPRDDILCWHPHLNKTLALEKCEWGEGYYFDS